VQGLPEETQCSIVDLVKARRTGGVQQRQGLAFSLHPEGLPYSPETTFVEPHNTLLMNGMHEMIDGLLSGKIVGVPLNSIFEHLDTTIAEATPLYELCASLLEPASG